jgi:hypothetical protein
MIHLFFCSTHLTIYHIGCSRISRSQNTFFIEHRRRLIGQFFPALNCPMHPTPQASSTALTHQLIQANPALSNNKMPAGHPQGQRQTTSKKLGLRLKCRFATAGVSRNATCSAKGWTFRENRVSIKGRPSGLIGRFGRSFNLFIGNF